MEEYREYRNEDEGEGDEEAESAKYELFDKISLRTGPTFMMLAMKTTATRRGKMPNWQTLPAASTGHVSICKTVQTFN